MPASRSVAYESLVRFFLAGPVGRPWLKLIGATSPAKARIICYLVVTAVVCLWIVIATFQITMAPFVR
jgi:hypothetical protein